MTALFEYDSYLRDRYKVFQLKGKFIEHETANHLLAELQTDISANTNRFLIDLGGLSHMNSVGINSIVKLVHLINLHQGSLVFSNVPDKVRELLELIRLNSVMSICENEEDGIQSLLN